MYERHIVQWEKHWASRNSTRMWTLSVKTTTPNDTDQVLEIISLCWYSSEGRKMKSMYVLAKISRYAWWLEKDVIKWAYGHCYFGYQSIVSVRVLHIVIPNYFKLNLFMFCSSGLFVMYCSVRAVAQSRPHKVS